MGHSTFNIPEGIIRDKVAWYVVIYQFDSEQVLVAKPTPQKGVASCSTAMLRRGTILHAPAFEELVVNTGDNTVVTLLTRLLGIPENRTDVALENSRDSYGVNIKHTLYYLFQKQGLVANKDQLFNYRQDDYNPGQTIRDTLPILLGVSSDNRYQLEYELRDAKRQLKLNEKLLEQPRDKKIIEEKQAINLYSEAMEVGIFISDSTSVNMDNRIKFLKRAQSWRPDKIPFEDDSRISFLEEKLSLLRKDRREAQARIDAARQFSKRAGGYENEAKEQLDRMDSIKALPINSETGKWQWPFSEKNLAMESPIAKKLLKELQLLDDNLNIAIGQRPKLDAYLVDLDSRAQNIKNTIIEMNAELSAAIATNEVIAQMGTRNSAAARVVGRISLFLENLIPDEELARLEDEYHRLKLRVDDLKQRVGTEDSDERLKSKLSIISSQITQFVQEFGAEFGDHPARLDLKKLSVIFDRPDSPVPMYRSGGGENHLAYHLSALLALHLFAFENNRPIPRFLLIDQPTQVYFPSEQVYQEADGSIQNTKDGSDIEAVRRLFKFLLKFTKEEAPGFQIIVTEHANLEDSWFQKALVEQPWTKPPALVPEDWE